VEHCTTYNSILVGCVAASQVPSVSEEHVALIFKGLRFTNAFFMDNEFLKLMCHIPLKHQETFPNTIILN
jgi:hypothetical protein